MIPFRFAGALIAVVCFYSCGEYRSAKQLAEINEVFDRSDRFVKLANEKMYHELDKRQYDPHTRLSASIWVPAALKMRSISQGLDAYFDTVSSQLREGGELSGNKRTELFTQLQLYKAGLIHAFDSVLVNGSDLTKADFAVLSRPLFLVRDSNMQSDNTPITLELLNKLRIDNHLFESGLLRFCIIETDATVDFFQKYEPLTVLSSSYVRAGEHIEVTSGIGAYSTIAQPKVTINGRPVKISYVTGMAVDTIKAERRPGKHSIVVSINFILPDGTPSTVTQSLPYTVAPGQ